MTTVSCRQEVGGGGGDGVVVDAKGQVTAHSLHPAARMSRRQLPLAVRSLRVINGGLGVICNDDDVRRRILT